MEGSLVYNQKTSMSDWNMMEGKSEHGGQANWSMMTRQTGKAGSMITGQFGTSTLFSVMTLQLTLIQL